MCITNTYNIIQYTTPSLLPIEFRGGFNPPFALKKGRLQLQTLQHYKEYHIHGGQC